MVLDSLEEHISNSYSTTFIKDLIFTEYMSVIYLVTGYRHSKKKKIAYVEWYLHVHKNKIPLHDL